MKSKTQNNTFLKFGLSAMLVMAVATAGADEFFNSGVVADIDYEVDGHVWIEDATVNMYEPAHIMGAVITSSGAVFEVYGGQIDYMLLVSTSNNGLPEAYVTIYGTDFMVDGSPVDPNTTELYLVGQTLSGVYVSGNPFEFLVDCAMTGSGENTYYQTVKLGWLISEPDIEISETEYDMGPVDIGQTQSGIVTVYNLGTANLTLQSLSLVQDENAQFDFTPLLQLPLTIEPDSAVDLEVLYIPTVEGVAEATLQIASDDPNNPVVEVTLTGEGIPVVLSPSEQIAEIIDYYDQAVEDGTIEGTGRRRCTHARLRIIRRMLRISQNLIDAGYDRYAIRVLWMLESKTDGRRRPTDFVKGEGVEELNTRIKELKETLKNK